MTHYKFLLKNKHKLYMVKNKVNFVALFRKMCELYYMTPEWEFKKAIVKMKQKYICGICKINWVEQTHHITYKNFLEEKINDLIGLCSNCHKAVHGYAEREFLIPFNELTKPIPRG